MDARTIVKNIMAIKEITNAELARKLSITQATLWERLNNKKMRKDIPVSSLVELLEPLGCKVFIRDMESGEDWEVTKESQTTQKLDKAVETAPSKPILSSADIDKLLADEPSPKGNKIKLK